MSTALSKIKDFHSRDIEFADRLSHWPIGSGYWTRVRIDKAVEESAALAHGVLLDVGCGVKPFEKLFESHVEKYLGLEYSPESGYRGNKADFCGDAGYLPLPDKSVDTILCTEVMEHLPDPERAIKEFERVLRPGGTVITTAPFFYPIHDAYDFFRYSPDGLKVMMERAGLRVDTVKPLSGTAVTLAAMFNAYWFDIGFMWTKWLYPIGLVLRPLLWLLCLIVNITGGVFEKLIPSAHMSFNHLTIAHKEKRIG